MENIFLSVWVMLIGEYNQVALALVALPPTTNIIPDIIKQFTYFQQIVMQILFFLLCLGIIHLVRTHTKCAHQGLRDTSFLGDFAYVLNK